MKKAIHIHIDHLTISQECANSGIAQPIESVVNALRKKMKAETSPNGSINVLDFQKLHANEWLRLIHILDTSLPKQELHALYRQLHGLPQTDLDRLMKKVAHQISETILGEIKNKAETFLKSPSDWRKFYPK